MSAGVWLHGEAVAAGTVMAADMSHRLGWIDQELLDRTRHLLERANLPVAPPQVRLTSYNILAAVSPGLLLGTYAPTTACKGGYFLSSRKCSDIGIAWLILYECVGTL